MKLSEFKKHLLTIDKVNFQFENGKEVPKHFHITELGQIDKKFMDCGGTVRIESAVSLQLWESVDVWHRLEPQKLLRIIELSEAKLGIQDHDIEVEYQGETIGKYSLAFSGNTFVLTSKNTACLASDSCGIPTAKVKNTFIELGQKVTSCCGSESACC